MTFNTRKRWDLVVCMGLFQVFWPMCMPVGTGWQGRDATPAPQLRSANSSLGTFDTETCRLATCPTV